MKRYPKALLFTVFMIVFGSNILYKHLESNSYEHLKKEHDDISYIVKN